MTKMTTEEFIAKAREIHGDKYDYSKTRFTATHNKVTVTCKIHGDFVIEARYLLKGGGCPQCSKRPLINTAIFIERAKAKFGNKFDYSKVNYVNQDTPVCVICPIHGEFNIKPSLFLNADKPCPKCRNNGGLTTEEWVAKATEVHNGKYNYSKVSYKKATDKVCIICPEHGEFWQPANVHLKGVGCPKCIGRNKNSDDVIGQIKKVLGDKYDYSKSVYVDSKTKICVTCPEHGDFYATPNSLLKGHGCPKCANVVQYTTDEWVAMAKAKWGNRFDYSKTEYKGGKEMVCIICPEHGEFWCTPSTHLKTGGCKKCTKKHQYTTEEWVALAKEKWGDVYDYSKTIYTRAKEKVCIICPIHGEFWQTPYDHLKGVGCPMCSTKVYDTNSFIAEAKKVHGDKYNYSKTIFKGSKEKVCIICPEHGEFWQSPYSHLQGHGCPICCNDGTTAGKLFRLNYKFNLLQEFKSEYAFREFLANNDINILQVILRNVEPKYEPLKKDIEKALANAESMNPIRALEEKYSSDNGNDEEPIDNEPATREEPIQNTPDLDDDDAMSDFINTMSGNNEPEEKEEPTIEEITRNREEEIKVINRIEHMLTPEDREYIMDKFLHDKRRDWMAKREQNK